MNRILIVFLIVTCSYSQLKASDQPTLDGLLDDTFWHSAREYHDFVQYLPVAGGRPGDSTSVMVKRSDEHLYIGFKVFTDESNKNYATVMERDRDLENDDYVEVIIDTYNNNTDALSFGTNMLGTKVDAELSENVTVVNKSWNTFWEVETEITEYGWNAEFKIPFASLRYEETENAVMGFKFFRQIVARNMMVAYPLKELNVDNALTNLNYAEKIPLGKLESKSRILFSPYVTSNFVQKSRLNDAGTAYSSNSDFILGKNYFKQDELDRLLSNIGLDIKYKLNSSNTLDVTLNTNYAQAEAEDRIINITRYSILIPEKRQFFLENDNLFSGAMFDHKMFHSRNIGTENGMAVPIIGGLRLSGFSGGYQYGLLNMQSSGIADEDISAKNFTVARLTKTVKDDESYVGGYVTHKSSTESSENNTVAGVDGIIRISQDIVAKGFIAASRGANNGESNSFGISLDKDPQEGMYFRLKLNEYQENFNPELGFLPRPNTRRVFVQGGYRIRFNEGYVSRFAFGNFNSLYRYSSNDQKQSAEHTLFSYLNLRNGTYILMYLPRYQKDYVYSDWNFNGNITIPADQYEMFKFRISYRSGNSNIYNYSLYASYGDFYNGKMLSLSGGLNYVHSSKFNAGIYYGYNQIKFPDSFAANGNGNEEIVAITSNVNYNISSSTSVSAYLQYDNASNTLGSNIRLRYNIAEGSDFYIVYNQLLNTTRFDYLPEKPSLQNQILIMKYTYTFVK